MGLVMIIVAISLLIFNNNLQGYVIQFTALGLSTLLAIQWNNNAKLYRLTNKNGFGVSYHSNYADGNGCMVYTYTAFYMGYTL